MGLRNVFDGWAQLFERYLLEDNVRKTDIAFGANELSRNMTHPRVTFVPTRGQIKWTTVPTPAGVAGPIGNRPLEGRVMGIELHIVGADFDEAEALEAAAAAAWHDLFWGSDDVINEDWSRGQEQTTRNGVLVVVSMTIEIPLVRHQEVLAPIQNFVPMTEQIVLPVAEGP